MMKAESQNFSIRKNDQVQVISGREKGKIGKVLKVDLKNSRILVEKTNLVKRHLRATQQQAGSIIEKELPLHYSNVLILCPKCNRGVRHGIQWVEKPSKSGESSSLKVKKKKIRVCKRCKEALDTA